MAARITELSVDSRDPAALAAWWAQVLDWEVLGTEDGATDRSQAEELDRLLALGATRVDVGQGPLTDEMTWHVLADPEGNEFCLLASTVAPLRG